MPVVKMPDGALVDMPDNPTEEQLAKLRELQNPAPKGMGDRLLDVGSAVGDYAVRAGKKMAGAAGNSYASILDFASSRGPLTADIRNADGTQYVNPISTKVQELAKALKEKSTGLGKSANIDGYAGAALEGIGGALSMPFGGAATVLGTGAVSGLAGEAADRAMQQAPGARTAGSLVGGVTAQVLASAIGRRMSPQVGKVAQEAMEGLTPDVLARAEAFQKRAASEGVKLDLSQAIEGIGAGGGNLEGLRNVLANSRHGNKTQALLREQPTQMELRAATQVGGMPGAVREEGIAANNVASAATQAITNAKRARSAETQRLYSQAGNLDEAAQQRLVDTARRLRNEPGTTESVKTALRDFENKLSKGALEDPPVPAHALDANTAIGEMTGPFKGSPISPADPRALGQSKNAGRELNAILTDASPETASAAARHAQISQDVVDPLKQSLVGQFATKQGYKPDTQASVTRLEGLFARGEDPTLRTSPIRSFAAELKKTDPEAFPDAFKTYVSGKVQSAFPPTLEGQQATDPKAVKQLFTSLGFDDGKKFNGLKQATAEIAKQNGIPEADAVRGLENFAQITKAAIARPAVVGGASRQELKDMAGNNSVSTAINMFGMIPFARTAEAFREHVMGKTLRQLDEVLTSPDGAKMLQELGKVPPNSDRARKIITTFAASLPTLPSKSDQITNP